MLYLAVPKQECHVGRGGEYSRLCLNLVTMNSLLSVAVGGEINRRPRCSMRVSSDIQSSPAQYHTHDLKGEGEGDDEGERMRATARASGRAEAREGEGEGEGERARVGGRG